MFLQKKKKIQRRLWLKPALEYKDVSNKLPAYNNDFIPPVRQSQRHPSTMNSFSCRTEYFKNSSFPYVEWNKLNPEIRSSGSYNIFHKSLLNFIRPSASKVYNINDTIGIKLITRLHLGFSHLPEHKVQHNFQDITFALFLKHRSRIYISLLSALPFLWCFVS